MLGVDRHFEKHISKRTPRGYERACKKDMHRGVSQQSRHHNFEGLYLSSDREFHQEPNLLYQGGTPCNEMTFKEHYKALPLSVAKINFKQEIHPHHIKLNKNYSENFSPFSGEITYDVSAKG